MELRPKLDSRTDAAVLDWLRVFLAEISVSQDQCRLLDNALAGLERTIGEIRAAGGVAAFIDAPVAIHAAEKGSGAGPPLALAGACSLVFLALDIFDDLADGDRQPHWEGWSPGEINLAAATLLVLPPLILGRLEVPVGVRAAMRDALTRGLLRMSAGQQADLAAMDREHIAPDAVEASVVGKSGEQQATYCELAARFAGVPEERTLAYAELGRCIGTAGQLASDCHELLCDPKMRDLANGARTLPLALHLARLQGPERDCFLALLNEARSDPAARLRIRDLLKDRGTIRFVLFRVGLYLQRARRAAEQACPDPARRSALAPLINGQDSLSPGEVAMG